MIGPQSGQFQDQGRREPQLPDGMDWQGPADWGQGAPEGDGGDDEEDEEKEGEE